MPRARQFSRVQFHVEAPLGHGQAIFVTGSGPALGDNDALSGVALYTTPAEYPRWSSDWVSVPNDTDLTYKYAIFEGEVFSHWEPAGTGKDGTRTMPITKDQVITDVLGVLPSPRASPPLPPVPLPRSAAALAAAAATVERKEKGVQWEEGTAKQVEEDLRRFDFAEETLEGEVGGEGGEPPSKVVINREDAEATASSLGDAPIDVKSFTPHTSMKSVSLRLGREDSLKGGGRKGSRDGTASQAGGGGGGAAVAYKRGRGGSASAAQAFLDPDEVSISPSDGVVVVSYFLPLIVSRAPSLPEGETETASRIKKRSGDAGLPGVRVDEGGEEEEEEGARDWIIAWDTENLLSLRTRLRVTWVGTVRLPAEIGGKLNREEQESLARALRKFDCVPVFIDPEIHDKFYNTFCKGTLWPVFHHILDVYGSRPTRFWDQKTQDSVWHSYSHVNMRFRDKVVEVYNEGDLIWIHGFHLLVLPSFITKSLPTAKTGLFLHTPFPSSEIFRTLSVREDLLRGMLNADHIGFHLYEYARHFVTCVRRILGVTYDMEGGQMAVHYNGRTVAISSIHVGVDSAAIRHLMLAEPEMQLEVDKLRQQFAGRKVILGIDRLERIRGIPLKLLAFERFLAAHPEWKGKVVLFQVGITASERGEDYPRTKREVRQMVTSINAAHADLPAPPVVFIERNERQMRLQDRMPLLAMADVFIVTSPRDGLNRMPLEFVAAQAVVVGGKEGGSASSSRRSSQVDLTAEGAAKGTVECPPPTEEDTPLPGVLILSEFVSCTRVLLGAMFVNPWQIEGTGELMARALGMSAEERLARHARDWRFVNSQTVLQWAYQILMDVKRVKKDVDRSFYSGVGLGLHYRVLGMDKGFHPLRVEDVARAYRQSTHRVIMLDYGGTLVSGSEKKENVQYYAVSNKLAHRKGPSKHLLSILRDLCNDFKNACFVVTGMERQALEQGFGEVENLGLGAEHGFFYKMPHAHHPPNHSPTVGGGWEMMLPSFDSSWMELTQAIMDVYVKRTHGTYIEQKGSALLWQYRDADPEFGHMQSKELEDHLSGVLRGAGVEILRGENKALQGGYLEVRPEGVHKGSFLEKVLGEMAEHGKVVDFLLVVGDDASDESMFTAAADYAANFPPNAVAAFSCTVGKKPSQARSFLNDVDEVHDLLGSIARCSRITRPTSRGFMSSVDLRQLVSGCESSADAEEEPGRPVLTKSLTTSSVGVASMKKNFSLGDLAGGRRAREGRDLTGEQPVPELLQSPSASAMTWATYIETIKEGNEDDGVFF
ncbi:trehalose phosphate synthase [Nannochloropsis gaditana]|uniref:Trehalose phosphate synthase n=1 Tax=Nannochloropsis gaditana TaxID=72520 RepID=W7TD30_9STRA|nr:trehalose phosphate synthase [Nannochloropsis gaditana]